MAKNNRFFGYGVATALVLLATCLGLCHGRSARASVYGKATGGISAADKTKLDGISTNDWWSQRAARAAFLLNQNFVQVDQMIRFDYTTYNPVLGGASAPTMIHSRSGVAYTISNGSLNDMPLSGATLIANPAAESWYFARKVSFSASTLSDGAIWPIHLVADGSNFIDIAVIVGFFAPHEILFMENAGASTVTDLGAPCGLGGTLSPCRVSDHHRGLV